MATVGVMALEAGQAGKVQVALTCRIVMISMMITIMTMIIITQNK